jgi:mono/diheme cytochrome c family protein
LQLEETIMRKLLLLLSVVILFGYRLLPGAAALTQEGSSAQAGKNSGQVSAHAKEIYKVDCAICHGETGDGKTDLAKDMSLTLLDWTDPKSLASKSDQDLFDVIRKGKDKMPPEDPGRAKDADVKGLIQYIRNFSKGAPAPATPTPATPAPAPESTTPTAPGTK